jgi:hypothetical protein
MSSARSVLSTYFAEVRPPFRVELELEAGKHFFFFAGVFHFFATDSTISPQIAHFRPFFSARL